MPSQVVEALRTMPLLVAAAVFLLQNLLVFAGALVFGEALIRAFPSRRASAPPPKLGATEIAAAGTAIVLNAGVTLAGLVLWRAGIVHFRDDTSAFVIVDVLVLLLGMDLAMYVLHRLAHHRWLFPLLHRLHHRYEQPRPLTLFVLNPVETVSFGALWLVAITVYSASWVGMSIYLVLNVVFGVLGHVGVEPFPRGAVRWPVARHLGTSTFHAQHHDTPTHNYGFYTLLWDRLFGTLHPTYERRFRGEIPAPTAPDVTPSNDLRTG